MGTMQPFAFGGGMPPMGPVGSGFAAEVVLALSQAKAMRQLQKAVERLEQSGTRLRPARGLCSRL